MTTALILLRAKQLNLTFNELNLITIGELLDMMTEQANDSYKYPVKGNQEDIDRFFGG